MTYKKQVAIIGARDLDDTALDLVENIGEMLVSQGYRIVTGGIGTLPKAAHRGAKRSHRAGEADTISILPGFDPIDAIEHADIIIPTGMDIARNLLVANSDAVIAVGGGAGTLSEIAFAWQLKRPILATSITGWSERLCDEKIDTRTRIETDYAQDIVFSCPTVETIRSKLREVLPIYSKRHKGIPNAPSDNMKDVL